MKKLNTNHQVIQRLLDISPRGTAWMRMFFMLVMMMMTSALATAQKTYGIKIAGVEVTSENCADLSVIPDVEGKVSYDVNTQTLTLENATINSSEVGIFIEKSRNIELIGKNTISAGMAALSVIDAYCVIRSKSAGNLKLNSSKDCAIYVKNSRISILNNEIYAEGKWGLKGERGNEKISIRNAYLESTGSEGSICNFESFELENCRLVQPKGAAFDATLKAVALNGKIVTDKVVIVPPKKYGIMVAGVEVTNFNCNDLSVIDGVEGNMSYNLETNTLTMQNVTINKETNITGIKVIDCNDLKIEVIGNNSITTESFGIYSKVPCTISGFGTLRLKNRDAGLRMLNTVTIEGVKLFVDGWWGNGLSGVDGETEILTLRNVYVEVTGIKGSICNLKSLVLDGCSIVEPEGAAFDATLKAVALNGKNVIDKVVIASDLKKYGVKVAGVEVTNINGDDLSVIDGVEGKVRYNPMTKTLTLEDATISSSRPVNGIYIEGDTKIILKGTNTISTPWACLSVSNSTSSISGTGTLTLNSNSNYIALYMNHSNITIEDVKIYAEGKWGISGENEGEYLTLRNAYLEATGTSGSVCDLNNLILDDCSIIRPVGATFDVDKHAVVKDGNVVTNKVIIASQNMQMYGIRVAGVEVTSENCAELNYIDGINSGEMSYDPKTNTLIMKEVSFSSSSTDCAIENYGCANLNIKVTGYVGIQTTEAECICLDEATTISGTGTIVTESEENEGIIFRKSLTIDGIRLYGENNCGITGENGDTEVLTVRNAYVKVGTICNIKSLVLDGSSIVQPEGAAFDATLKGVAFEGDLATDVLIKPTDYLGIDVAGVMVTKANCADLSVLDGVTGKLSYDPMTNTLTMQDCTISPTTSDLGLFIEEGKDLKVEILGNNNITARDGCIMLYGKSIISGSGTLNVTCSNNTAIFARTPSLTIEGIRLIVEGDWSGITGFDGQTEVITVRNAYVEVTGGLGSIDDIKDLVLEGCSIVQPKGAAFDATLKCVALNGEVVKDKVVIEPDASGINDITADVPARKKGVFTVQGVKQTQSWNELPAGVYIVDGVKRVKR